MVSKSVASSMLVLRVLALAALAIALAVLACNNVKYEDGTKVKFQDLKSYRFVVAVVVVSATYGIVQLPFAIYYALKQKRLIMITNGFSRKFDFYGDKVITVVLAAGIGVGFAVSIELRKLFDSEFDAMNVPQNDPTRNTNDKFFIRGIVASAILCVPLLCMFVVSVLSFNIRSKN